MRADRKHMHGKHAGGHQSAGGSITQKSPTLNPMHPLPCVWNLGAYSAMLGWAQQGNAGQRLHDYLGSRHVGSFTEAVAAN